MIFALATRGAGEEEEESYRRHSFNKNDLMPLSLKVKYFQGISSVVITEEIKIKLK